MVNTQGFQTVAEITEATLLSLLREAWRSGSLNNNGTLPQEIQLPAGMPLGPFSLADGTVQIPQDEVRLNLNPVINGIDLILGMEIDLEIANPPVPSAQLFNLTADVTLRLPVGNAPDPSAPVNLALLLEDLPTDAVDVMITSGDPFADLLENGPEEYIHQLYQDGTIPHLVEDIPLNFGPFSMMASIQFFDDESDPTKSIAVSYPPESIEVNIPVYIRFYDITDTIPFFSLATPMGVFAIARLTMPFSRTDSHIHIGTDSINADLVSITPGPGEEGDNYDINKDLVDAARSFFPALPPLEDAIRTGFITAANTFFTGRPPVNFDIPTIADLELQVEQFIRAEMDNRRWIIIWAPEGQLAEGLSADDIVPKVLEEAFAIAFNGGIGANADLLENFILPSCDFAFALDDDFIESLFRENIDEQFPELPVTLPREQTDGREIRLESIDINLVDGAIRVTGSLTAVDVILGSIDVGVNFTVNMGLRWIDNSDGTQMLEPFVIDEPDVDIDLDLLGWILSFLIGFVSGGFLGGIIAVIVLAIVIKIVESIGGGVARDALGNVTGVAAWPVDLPNIGSINARFKNPVDIFSTGVRFIGEMTIVSASTAVLDAADANGPYGGVASVLVSFNGGADQAFSRPQWNFGDGNSSLVRQSDHRYGDSGQYIAKLRIEVDETGGAITRNFTTVRLQNVSPKVNLPTSLSVNEGQEVEIIGSFTDSEWLDTHTAIFDWGDNSKPTVAIIAETNTEPEARGTASAMHAWCDNGLYTVRLTVIDDDGGIGETSMQVTVLNLPPKVMSDEAICTLVGQEILLHAEFEDEGWCDVHTATWNFGDCTEKNAFIVEVNEPPKAIGEVSISHLWEHCGQYITQVTVTDDDGGSGSARTVVQVVELKNKNMENGFHHFAQGSPDDPNRVANGWFPYASPVLTLDTRALDQPREWLFFGEQFVEREGRRAQGVRFRGAMQAGIYQQICANKGWDYFFCADFHFITTRKTGHARIGIDPMGGTDPNSPNIIWRELPSEPQWGTITVRTTARTNQITLLIGGIDRFAGQNIIYIDKVDLCQIQPTLCSTEEEEPCKETCVNFNDLAVGQNFAPGSPSLTHHGINFSSLVNLYIIGIAMPVPFHHGLFFSPRGIEVKLPQKLRKVKVTMHNRGGGSDFKIDILSVGLVIDQIPAILNPGTEDEFILSATILDGFRIRDQQMELSIIKICFCLEKEPGRSPIPQ
ncbi:PKD domain-containing protein [Flavilitoribacter nigricans]|uniref:PKD domain-containing protein n=1 Tax=Flavilitoribacter nigricans (strain ATCC 23147 / DSM 23189 / NBRC 102662 / NCIMB 1420 / SS-2) TaxID=1122177 RepID=A0A2D0MXD0_FLAN2|nr:PKD domain-containing protein [Flavilitoribacter nigricans]PHN00932.1 hypothetical protein CRP01_39750 [Flavilitoribacter nigricans DSM 23189 = NBRC 102662]